MKDLSTYRDETFGFLNDMRKTVRNLLGDYLPSRRSYPHIDVREESSKYVVEAEIPGVTEKDIDVSVQNNMLSISSKHVEETEQKHEGYLVRERRSSSFSRQFTMPDDADQEHITADYNQGLLTLSIPKIAQEKQIKHIKIAKQEKETKETKAKEGKQEA